MILRRSISGVGEVVLAFGWRDRAEAVADRVCHDIDGPSTAVPLIGEPSGAASGARLMNVRNYGGILRGTGSYMEDLGSTSRSPSDAPRHSQNP